MAVRLALKQLTASDLTLFEALFRRLGAGNQKAINLNADVFVNDFYPATLIEAPARNQIPVALSIFGPGAKPVHRLTRKIIKNATYKNWRLDGEFIRGPEDDSGRYDSLQPDDLALLLFHGDPLPEALDIVLLARDLSEDTKLHAALAPLLHGRSMVPLTMENVTSAIAPTNASKEHPINQLVRDPALDAALEDAALGGELGTRALLRRRSGRKVSAADLALARQNAERTGLAGEGLIDAYFRKAAKDGLLIDHVWSAEDNAVCPYDFQIRTSAGVEIKLDVKSTAGPFENNIHISIAELIEAAKAPERYDLYRLYDVKEEGGRLRISEDIRNFAQAVLAKLDLPAGVRCDSFSISVSDSGLNWGAEQYIPRPSGDDGGDEA